MLHKLVLAIVVFFFALVVASDDRWESFSDDGVIIFNITDPEFMITEFFGLIDWESDEDFNQSLTRSVEGSCSVPGVGSGNCQDRNGGCSGGSFYPGHCPGSSAIQCCVRGGSGPNPGPRPGPTGGGWSRESCASVANSWLSRGVLYDWRANGPGGYRADCSGLVSASWGFSAPGYTTATIPGQRISASELKPCDALLRRGSPGHIALFMGWSSSGSPLVIEECGHGRSCCSSGYTCPGACSKGGKCQMYCPGCPIQRRSWAGVGSYTPFRRNGW